MAAEITRTDVTAGLRELAETALRTAEQIGPELERAAAMVQETVRRGGTLFFCGNGATVSQQTHWFISGPSAKPQDHGGWNAWIVPGEDMIWGIVQIPNVGSFYWRATRAQGDVGLYRDDRHAAFGAETEVIKAMLEDVRQFGVAQQGF